MTYETLLSFMPVVIGLLFTPAVQWLKKIQAFANVEPRLILVVLVALTLTVWVLATGSIMDINEIIKQAEALVGTAVLGHLVLQKGKRK